MIRRGRASLLATVCMVAISASVLPALGHAAPNRTRPAITEATVERTDTGQLTIAWKPTPGVRVKQVTWSNDPDDVDEVLVRSVPRGVHEVTVDDPSPGARPYFALVVDQGTRAIVAERRIALEGDSNFRDLGGYHTKDGRSVRWGRIYRSGELDALTDADLATVDGLDIKLVCDLRAPSEISIAPDRSPTGAETISIPVTDDSQDPVVIREQVLAGDVSALGEPGELLTEAGKTFPTKYAPEFEKVMARLMDVRYQPALVHCSAGKDRAGLASALVLLTLGVPEKAVMQDYLLSNRFRAEENERAVSGVQALLDAEGVEVIRWLVEVRPQYLQASLDTMRGGVRVDRRLPPQGPGDLRRGARPLPEADARTYVGTAEWAKRGRFGSASWRRARRQRVSTVSRLARQKASGTPRSTCRTTSWIIRSVRSRRWRWRRKPRPRCASAPWCSATTTAIPSCSRATPRRSTCCRMAGSSSASARDG